MSGCLSYCSGADTSSYGISSFPVLNYYLTKEYYCVAGKSPSVREEICVCVSQMLQRTPTGAEPPIIEPLSDHEVLLRHW